MPVAVPAVGKHLFDVTDTFVITGRGTVIVGDRRAADLSPHVVRVGDELVVCPPQGVAFTAKVSGTEIEMAHRRNAPISVIVAEDPATFPIGSAIWSVPAP